MNIHQLESKAKPTTEEAMTVFHHHEQLMEAARGDMKRLRKVSKGAAHAAIRAFEAGVREPAALQRFLTVLEFGSAAHSFPQAFYKATAKIQAALQGDQPEPKTLDERKGKVVLETALFCLGDPARLGELAGSDPDIAHTRAGKVLYVGTGCDGRHAAILRLKSGSVPLLDSQEQKKSQGATAMAVLEIGSRTIGCADYGGQPQLTLDVEPGRYAVIGYLVGAKYIFVFCRCDAEPGTKAVEIATLEPAH